MRVALYSGSIRVSSWRAFSMEKVMLTYSLKLAWNYDGMVVATFPDVPECYALGRDDEEAVEEARRSLEAVLERYADEGREFPIPRAGGTLKVTTERFGQLTAA